MNEAMIKRPGHGTMASAFHQKRHVAASVWFNEARISISSF